MFKWIKAIKAFLTAKKEITILMGKKDGWKTTEFWVNLIIIIVTVFASIMSFIPADLAAKIIAVTAGIYTIARTIVKLTSTTVDDEAVEKVGKVLAEKLGIKAEQK